MDINTIITLISTLGFPITMCIYQIYINNSTLKELRRAIDNLTISVSDTTRICSLMEQHFFQLNQNTKE